MSEISQIENVITTTLRARGGNVVAQMGQWSQGFGQLGGKINDATRMSERLNNQWRAVGTTLRYALAGSVIFGLARMVTQVKDLNVQLGQMQAISGIGPGTVFSNKDINSLLGNLEGVANDTITPLNQVNDAAVNFLSTVQNVKPSQLPAMLDMIGRGAKLAQTPVEDLTQAATTMQIAFGRSVNPTTIGQFTRMWSTLIGIAPGGISAAPTIAQSMPGLASMFQLAPGRQPAAQSQAQMMGLTLGVLRTGMPAATAMRGLTYLLQSIAQPTGGAKQALAGIGITPQFVQQNGIFAGVMRLLNTITQTGNAKQIGSLSDDALDQIDTSGGSLPGIPANEMSRLRTMIPRIHGIRAAIILASQLRQQGDVSSIMQDVQTMQQAQDVNSQQSKQLADAWNNLRKRSRLADAANAVNTMQLQMAQAFEPVMGFVAQHVINPITRGAQHHQTATRDISLGAGMFLAAMGIGRFAGLGNTRLGKVPGIGRLLGGGLGNAFVRTHAIESAMSGNAALGATPQNPIYVVVVGQIFGGSTSSPTAPVPSGGGKGWLSRIAGYTGLAAASRYGMSALRGAGGALLHYGAETPALGDFISGLVNEKDVTTGQPLGSFWRALLGTGDFKNAQDYQTALHRAQKLYPGTTGIEKFSKGQLRGRADINMTLDMTDANGKKVTKKVHVPVDLWSGGRVPMTKGKSGTTRRGK